MKVEKLVKEGGIKSEIFQRKILQKELITKFPKAF